MLLGSQLIWMKVMNIWYVITCNPHPTQTLQPNTIALSAFATLKLLCSFYLNNHFSVLVCNCNVISVYSPKGMMTLKTREHD